jgi:hypothetical protein
VWQSAGSSGTDTDGTSIQGQRYDAGGNPVGGEFQVNSYTTGGQFMPSVAMDAEGNFIVTWNSYGSSGSYGGAVYSAPAAPASPMPEGTDAPPAPENPQTYYGRPADNVVLNVRVPSGAKVFVNGAKTTSTGRSKSSAWPSTQPCPSAQPTTLITAHTISLEPSSLSADAVVATKGDAAMRQAPATQECFPIPICFLLFQNPIKTITRQQNPCSPLSENILFPQDTRPTRLPNATAKGFAVRPWPKCSE